MKKSVIFFFVLLSVSSNAQFTVKGIIIDSKTKERIQNVNISEPGGKNSTSDVSGYFYFRNIKSDFIKLHFSHINYIPDSLSVEIYSDTVLTIYLSPKTISLKDVIVTSGKFEQKKEDLTYSSSIITESEITKYPAATVSELLKSEPGLALIRDGNWGTELNIRGLSRSNIVTMIDGNRIETATDLSARLSMIDISDIERIEVIKGAASYLYGSGATGGMINTITKTADYRDKFYINGSTVSSFNSVNNNLSNYISLFSGNDFFRTKVSASFRKAGNTKTPSSMLKNSQFTDYSFNAAVSFIPSQNNEISFNFQQFKAEDIGIPGAYGVFPDNASVRYPVELRRLFSISYQINNISDYFSRFSVKYFNQFILRDVENIPNIVQTIPGQPVRRVSVLSINPSAEHNTNGLQAQINLTDKRSHYFIAGIDLWQRKYNGIRTREQKIDFINPATGETNNTIYKTIIEKPLPDAVYSNAGIFFQDEIKVTDKNLRIIIGGRYDLIKIKNNEVSSPLYEINNGIVNYNPPGQTKLWSSSSSINNSYVYNLGILWSASDNVVFSANVSRSFRSPSLEERFQYIDLGNILRLGNPYLKPETGNFFDFGIRLKNNNFNFNGSIFANYLRNLVSENPAVFEGRNAFVKVNIGKAFLYGYDFDFSAQISDKFTIYGNSSFVRGENVKDKSNLPQIPPLRAVTGIRSDIFPEVEIDFSGSFIHSQYKTAPGEIFSTGYAYYNLYLTSDKFNFGLVNCLFSAGIENIFNREYRDHLSTSRGIVKSEPGRNFYFKINLTW